MSSAGCPKCTGESRKRKGRVQGLKFPAQTQRQLTESVYAIRERKLHLLQLQNWDFWKPNSESHPTSSWITKQTEFSTSQGIYSVKQRALSGKEQDPEDWNGDIWADPDAAGDAKPLNPAESSLPVEAALLSPSEEVSPALPEETVTTRPE